MIADLRDLARLHRVATLRELVDLVVTASGTARVSKLRSSARIVVAWLTRHIGFEWKLESKEPQ
jgi:hypothetical protein